ncbi:MAG: c-type cytochrome [Pseudomonadales bacterium]
MTLKRIALAVCVLSASQMSVAADIEAGKQASQACMACHGAAGVSNNEIWPNLAGQKAGYLAKQMRDFKAGKRTDPAMSAMANAIADDQIDNIAAYYASLKP